MGTWAALELLNADCWERVLEFTDTRSLGQLAGVSKDLCTIVRAYRPEADPATRPVLHVLVKDHDRGLVTAAWPGYSFCFDCTDPAFRFDGHQGRVMSMCLSANGASLYTASADRTCKVWDVATARLLATLSGHTKQVTSVCVDAQGHCFTGSVDKTARMWTVSGNGSAVVRSFSHTGYVYSVCVDAHGHLFTATGGSNARDNVATQWNFETGERVRVFSGHTGPCRAVCVDSQGRPVTASGDGTAKLWDPSTGDSILTLGDGTHHLLEYGGHTGLVASVCAHAEYIFTGSHDKLVIMWDMTGALVQIFRGCEDFVNSVCVHDGHLFAGCEDGKTIMWPLWPTAGTRAVRVFADRTNAVRCVCAHGEHVFTGSWGYTARMWHAKKLPRAAQSVSGVVKTSAWAHEAATSPRWGNG